MIDVTQERMIRLEDVRNHLPSNRRGKQLSKGVIFRWALHGVRGVMLETIRVGGARLTSIEALQRFVAAQNGSSVPQPSKVRPLHRARKAADELRKFNI